MEIIKIGKREVSKDQFIQAVVNAKSVADISIGIGFNPIPSTTKENVKAMVSQLGLNTSHIKCYNRIARPEVTQARVKQFNLSKDNEQYLTAFLPTIAERSAASYKSSCGNFMESIGSQDFITVTKEQIMKYTSTKETESMVNNTTAHLRSLMIFSINNDVNGAVEKVSKQMLIWLISK
jgi:hypothetical protein